MRESRTPCSQHVTDAMQIDWIIYATPDIVKVRKFESTMPLRRQLGDLYEIW